MVTEELNGYSHSEKRALKGDVNEKGRLYCAGLAFSYL